MPGPVSRVIEDTILMGGKAVDQVLRQVTPLHVCEGSVVDDSPSLAELALAANWNRVVERKATGLAFLVSRVVSV